MSFLSNLFGKSKTPLPVEHDVLYTSPKTSSASLWSKLRDVFKSKQKLDVEEVEQIEELLLSSDVGYDLSMKILAQVEKYARQQGTEERRSWEEILKQELLQLFDLDITNELNKKWEKDKLVLVFMVGINGAGKTTSMAKLAYWLNKQGYRVALAAADTYRAAAVAQISQWAERLKIPIIAKEQGSDPAAVVFEASEYAKKNKIDVLLIDTAGRLQNKQHLMEELSKMKRVAAKANPDAYQEMILVIDGSTGQNALEQARIFNETVNITGFIVTKLEGTAKGGIVFALAQQFRKPIYFIGIGERVEDFKIFNAQHYVEDLLGDHRV